MAKSIASSYLANSRRSFASSVRKNPEFVLSRRSQESKVNFKLPSDLQKVLNDVAQKSDRKQYEDLVSAVKDVEIKDEDFYHLIREVRKNIAMLNKSLHQFVYVLLKLKWAHRLQICSDEYGAFLVDLLSTHNYYTKRVLEMLVDTFKAEECYEAVDGVPTEKAARCCSNLHNVIGILIRVIPMASHVLCEMVKKKYPYHRHSAREQQSFAANVLKIPVYFPNLQFELFHLVVERLILLDVNTSKSELYNTPIDCPNEASELTIFDMEDASINNTMSPVAHSLDLTLYCVFQYIYSSCYNTSDGGSELICDKTLQFYNNLVLIFNEVILPTDTTHHVQFLLFYLCSFDQTLMGKFLDYLWAKVIRVEEDLVIQQKSVAYLVGMTARARFVPISVAKKILAMLATWVHDYIDKQEHRSFLLPELRMHPLFYSLCQAIFYLVTVRHRDLLHPNQNLELVQKLNITKIVSSQLNPLRVCHPEVIDGFARVAKAYQLAYCDSIIEQNNRSDLPVIHHYEHGTGLNPCIEKEVLAAYFPFDSFLLPRSKEFIHPLYRQCEDFLESPQQPSEKCDDIDDFMSEQLSSSIPNMLTRLSVSES